jgi:hypothetical protein
LTGSSGFDRVSQVNSYFKNNSKRRRFSKEKTKVNGLHRVLPGQPGHRVNLPGHGLCYFFINPTSFQPQVNPLGRAGFQNTDCNCNF